MHSTTTDSATKGFTTSTSVNNAGPTTHIAVSAGNMQYVSIADGDDNSSSRAMHTCNTRDEDNDS